MTPVLTLPTANIDEERRPNKIYWDCYNGFRNFKNPDKEMSCPSTLHEDVEQLFLSSSEHRDFANRTKQKEM